MFCFEKIINEYCELLNKEELDVDEVDEVDEEDEEVIKYGSRYRPRVGVRIFVKPTISLKTLIYYKDIYKEYNGKKYRKTEMVNIEVEEKGEIIELSYEYGWGRVITIKWDRFSESVEFCRYCDFEAGNGYYGNFSLEIEKLFEISEIRIKNPNQLEFEFE